MRYKIYIIVAVSKNGVIGNKNQIPWNIKEDMQFFKKTTETHCLLMGKNTWLSLPKKPLKNRVHFIISSDIINSFKSISDITNTQYVTIMVEENPIIFFDTILSAIQYWNNKYSFCKNLFIAGGGKIYENVLNNHLSFISGVYCTHIKKDIDGDTFFPLQKVNQLSKNIIPIFSNDNIDICFYEF